MVALPQKNSERLKQKKIMHGYEKDEVFSFHIQAAALWLNIPEQIMSAPLRCR